MEKLVYFKEVLHPNSIHKAREYKKGKITEDGFEIMDLTLERGNVQELTVSLRGPGWNYNKTRVHDLKTFSCYEYVASAKWTGPSRKRQ